MEQLLSMETRTGIKNEDIDDFLQRVEQVNREITDLKEGRVDLAALESQRQQKEDEENENLRREETRRHNELLCERKKKAEERTIWWQRAELTIVGKNEGSRRESPTNKGDLPHGANKWTNRVVAAYKSKDALDYSTWDCLELTDPASLDEKAIRESELTKTQDKQFEAANPDFCKQVMEDLQDRHKQTQRKEIEAEELRNKGNKLFREKQYKAALSCYHKSLMLSAFSVRTLTNIAQSHMRQNELEDVIEFCDRALFIDEKCVKALSRRALANRQLGHLDKAVKDLEKAVEICPENADVLKEYQTAKGMLLDSKAEEQVKEELTDAKSRLCTSELTVLDALLVDIMKFGSSLSSSKATQLMLTALAGSLNTPSSRWQRVSVLLRTSGGLGVICTALKHFATASMSSQTPVRCTIPVSEPVARTGSVKEDDKDKFRQPDTVTTKEATRMCLIILPLLLVALNKELRNQEVCLRTIGLEPFLLLLSPCQGLDVKTEALKVICVCSNAGVWQQAISTDAVGMRGLITAMSVNNSTAAFYSSKALQNIAKRKEFRGHLYKATPCLVGAIAEILQANTRSTLHHKELRENLSDLAFQLSLLTVEVQRVWPVVKIVEGLLSVARGRTIDSQHAREASLAALLNATSEASGRIGQKIAAHGFVGYLCTALSRKDCDGLGSAALTTSLALLSRVSRYSLASTALQEPKALELLFRLLSSPSMESSAKSTTTHGIQSDSNEVIKNKRVQHLVRILATILSKSCTLSDGLPWFAKRTSCTSSAKCFLQAHSSPLHLIASFLPFAQMERRQGDAICLRPSTPDRVKNVREETHLIGNVLKILIGCPVENLLDPHLLVGKLPKLNENGALLPRLVLCLQDLEDGPSRSNASILLARLLQATKTAARDNPKGQERLQRYFDDLRVMDMIRSIAFSETTKAKQSNMASSSAAAATA